MDKSELYRKIPKVDKVLEMDSITALKERYGHTLVVEAINKINQELRDMIAGLSEDDPEQLLYINEIIEHIDEKTEEELKQKTRSNMKSVINGTGTILHTNLGRALISPKHMEEIWDIMTGYSNLEYDLDTLKRGERYSHFEKLLCRLTGAEAAMAVNNNASAVMLILSSLSCKKEVIVSRGELVEIGGAFRVPDVMKQSRAKLIEIGTTNKTHLRDYENAINDKTSALLKVHTSNYRIVGFTESVSVAQLTELAHKHSLPVIEDLGSGVLVDLERYGLEHEPTVQESIKAGADIVCFSGDKLLGGPQCGIIIGRRKYIEKMKKNPLTRAFRIDKFTASCLECVLKEYLDPEKCIENIPTLRMITTPAAEIRLRAESLCEMIHKECTQAKGDSDISFEVVPSRAQIGGGSLPLTEIDSYALSIKSPTLSDELITEKMSKLGTPIIPHIIKGEVLVDVRTIPEEQLTLAANELAGL